MDDDRIVNPEQTNEEAAFEVNIRPRRLAEYVGQSRVKDNLSVFIRAAKDRGEALDHVLLFGPPGLGKTTLANILANELGVDIRSTSGPAMERSGDLAAILTNLDDRGVFFIDEIHRMNRVVEEVLYPAMEDFCLDLIIGKGPGARTVKLDLPKFTLIGATTRMGLLSSPFRDRFGVVFRLEYYSVGELKQIITRAARILEVELTGDAADEVASRSRGTPRVANRLLKRARDFAQVEAEGIITLEVARHTLERLQIDEVGLDGLDRAVLLTIIDKFAGGPVGIETIAASIGEERDTIEDICEPYLLQEGYIQRTPRGRTATESAYRHLG
ncbi:Holliday junction branch migration DNA helicase RuvB, partial [bacterium]|nr:Holliday junction branch migration DNA helicase RuvB [bacterium]